MFSSGSFTFFKASRTSFSVTAMGFSRFLVFTRSVLPGQSRPYCFRTKRTEASAGILRLSLGQSLMKRGDDLTHRFSLKGRHQVGGAPENSLGYFREYDYRVSGPQFQSLCAIEEPSIIPRGGPWVEKLLEKLHFVE